MNIGEDLIATELMRIIDKTPIAVRDVLKYYDKPTNQVRYLRGIADRIPWRQVGAGVLVDKLGFSEYGIGLSAYCDNIPETLLHEVIHVYRAKHGLDKMDTDRDERETDEMTNKFFKHKTLKNKLVEKTIQLLGDKGY